MSPGMVSGTQPPQQRTTGKQTLFGFLFFLLQLFGLKMPKLDSACVENMNYSAKHTTADDMTHQADVTSNTHPY